MENFALVLVCISLGYIIRRCVTLPHDAYKGVNAWVIYVAVPALALRYISAINWSLDMVLPAVSPLVIWFGASAYLAVYARFRPMDRETRVALQVTSGLGNTSFLGFPLITAFYGSGALSIAAICDFSTAMIFCTLAVSMILSSAHGETSTKPLLIIKRMLGFPVFPASIAALLIPRFTDMSFLYPFLEMLSSTVSPLALFSIGLQLQFKDFGENMGHVAAGLFYKQIIAPAVVLVMALLAGVGGQVAQVSVLEAGMAPHIAVSLLASQYGQNPRLCALMVCVGIACTLVTAPLLWLLVEQIF